MSGNITYSQVYIKLSETTSDLNTEKKRFEDTFQLFLNKYRVYSTVGKNLSDPVFDIRNISELMR
jgi:hypothetical protein